MHVVVGLAVGLAFGFASIVFNYIPNKKVQVWAKFCYCVFFSIAATLGDQIPDWGEAKYLGTLFFGYVCQKMWKDVSCKGELKVFWVYMQTFLFTFTGSNLLFEVITPSVIWQVIVLVYVCVLVRIAIAFFASYNGVFNRKERLFIAFTWFPKATIQATLSFVFLGAALDNNLGEEYEEYGNII
mmetsp:Transcript_8502/g.7855  ORF Transcript_8502/g.7855 Transcript_8502/m.7855 type:complete len:184 (+) Transcript_8502:732-1283(+)